MRKIIRIFLCVVSVLSLILPAVAKSADILFNQVRICVDGVTKTNWDENIKDTDMPSSITYKDTTYVPLRWISENMNRAVSWNGDSKTVSINETDEDMKFLAEKNDINGNKWKYELLLTDDAKHYLTATHEKYYLTVTDEKRNFQRKYLIAGRQAYKLEDEYILFMNNFGKIFKLMFLNDENSQDGEEIVQLSASPDLQAIFDEEYVYSIYSTIGNGKHGVLSVYNMNTKKSELYHLSNWNCFSNLNVKKSDSNTVVFELDILTNSPVKYMAEISYDKNNMAFSELKTKSLQLSMKKRLSDGLTFEDFDFFDELPNSSSHERYMENIFYYVGKSECIIDHGYMCYIYKLNDGNKVVFEDQVYCLAKYLELPDGTRIPLEIKEGALQSSAGVGYFS